MRFNPHQRGFLAEINVTPFVDVMLVLLIIFMVTAPMLTQGVEVDLPRTKTVETLPEDSDHLVLSIKKDGSLFLDTYAVKMDAMETHLKRLVKDKNKLVYLKADKDVPYGVVVKVMARVKKAGIEKLGVVAEPEDVH
ncbi:protein TolR [Desulfoplanes formicivorans]|uniref:Biopolymer transporter ExbD n=1 Tax=Desulfoplanes formicivorans TaxID=1592317 RepID=A0A194AKD1_9BACT|nr:protein TolR [Desulfoplanes formicivorans]GAU09773.1 biopolymer transporter ExbD [Desulfoplanes formicivorans]